MVPSEYIPALVTETSSRALSPCTQSMFPLCCELPIWVPPLPLDKENNFLNWQEHVAWWRLKLVLSAWRCCFQWGFYYTLVIYLFIFWHCMLKATVKALIECQLACQRVNNMSTTAVYVCEREKETESSSPRETEVCGSTCKGKPFCILQPSLFTGLFLSYTEYK